jgi:hypothetical protein
MAKRFTDTDKYKKPFIRGLQGAYKLLWDYLYLDCNHAGIWIVDFEVAQIYLGSDMAVNKEDAIKYFNNGEIRIVEIDNGKKWFIPSFIDFQYGELNENNRAHNSVIQILNKYKLFNNKGLIRVYQEPMDKDKDKDKDKVKEKKCLFKNSKFYNKELFINEFTDTDYKDADLNYYYELVKNWSESNNAMRINWIAVTRNIILRDKKDGKIVLKSGLSKTTKLNEPIR